MATSTEQNQARGDQRVAFRASWDLYQALTREIGDQAIRLSYDGMKVELMSPGPLHEKDKARLERLVAVLTEELMIPCMAMGSTRWERPAAWRGLEADATFYLTEAKVIAAQHRSTDITDYPIPDLAIEVDYSPAKIDRDSVYVALAIPEVWNYDGDEARFFQLGPDGTYQGVVQSPSLKIRSTDLADWMQVDAHDDNHWARLFRAWAANQKKSWNQEDNNE